MKVRFVAGCLFGAVLMSSASTVYAQVAGVQSPSLPPSVVSGFVANPSQLLVQFPGGGAQLIKQVRDLLSSDKATLPAIMGLLQAASPDQQTAIADGLAQAAKAYAQNDPGFANQIQQAVANSGIPGVVKSYADIAGDTGTAATGGGGGGGAGGGQVGAPPTGGQNNGLPANGSNPVTNTANYLTGGTVGGASATSTTTTVNQTINQVSNF